MIAVSESFYSLQGEGMTIGYPALFIRLGGCNLMCGGFGTQYDNQLYNGASWRCDTIEVWMKSHMMSFEDIFNDDYKIAIERGAHIVITGGEPLLQQNAICEMIRYVRENINPLAFIEIETNGTIMPSKEMLQLIDQWNISPKLSNSGNDIGLRYNKAVLEFLSIMDNAQFKFVISSEEDLNEVLTDFSFIHPSMIYLMPAGSNQEELKQTRDLVANLCKFNHIKMTDRLHISIWNKKTGV